MVRIFGFRYFFDRKLFTNWYFSIPSIPVTAGYTVHKAIEQYRYRTKVTESKEENVLAKKIVNF